ncbi:MAG: hypothetical protein V4480_03040 [Patescibacteria group bacterium]
MNDSTESEKSALQKPISELWKTSPVTRVTTVVVVLILILIVWGSGTPAPTYQYQYVPDTSSQPAVSTTGTYQEVLTFSGNGPKRSEPFTIIGSRFKITYDCKAMYCGAFVFNTSDQMPRALMNSPEAVSDETVFYGSGQYYIDTNIVNGSYTMTVYDYK